MISSGTAMAAGGASGLSALNANGLFPVAQRDAFAVAVTRLEVEQSELIRCTGARECACGLVGQLSKSSGGQPQNICLARAVTAPHAHDFHAGALERRNVIEEENIGCRHALSRRGVADQNAEQGEVGDVAHRLERDAQSRAGGVVRPKDGRGGGEIADQESQTRCRERRRHGPAAEVFTVRRDGQTRRMVKRRTEQLAAQ